MVKKLTNLNFSRRTNSKLGGMTLCKALQVKYLRTTAYLPQSIGLIERFNRTMTDMIRKYLEQGFTRWEDALGPIGFAYRNSVHTSTNETPYFLNHDPVLPIYEFIQLSNSTSTFRL